MFDDINDTNSATVLDDDVPVRTLFDKRTPSGRPFTAADSVACAMVARARARRLRERGEPVAALVFSHHAGRHMLLARCLATETAA